MAAAIADNDGIEIGDAGSTLVATSAIPAVLAAAFQSIAYRLVPFVVAVYGNVVDAVPKQIFGIAESVIVGVGLIVKLTAAVPEQPGALCTVIVPLYVPATTAPKPLIVIGLAGSAVNATSLTPAAFAAAFQSILYCVGVLVVAVYGNCTEPTPLQAEPDAPMVIVGGTHVDRLHAEAAAHKLAILAFEAAPQIPGPQGEKNPTRCISEWSVTVPGGLDPVSVPARAPDWYNSAWQEGLP